MEALRNALMNNLPRQWGVAIAVSLGMMAAVALIRRVVLGRLTPRVLTHPSLAVRLGVAVAVHTTPLFEAMFGLELGALLLHLPRLWHQRAKELLGVTVLLQVAYWAQHLISTSSENLCEDRLDSARESARHFVRLAMSLVLWAGVTLLALENLGVNVSALITGLGVTGVAVALATQNIVGDLFASLSIILDKPFQVGDFVVVDAYMGTVERIGVRTSRLRSLSGEEIILANGDLSKSRIRNYRTMPQRRVLFNFTVRYETSVQTVREIPRLVREAIESVPDARFDRAELMTLGDVGLGYEVVYYVKGGDYNTYTKTQQAINYGIMERFADAGVVFAYRTVINLNTEAPDFMLDRSPPAAEGQGESLI